jgi:hypothetical protein
VDTPVNTPKGLVPERLTELLDVRSGQHRHAAKQSRIDWQASLIASCFQPLPPKRQRLHRGGEQLLQLLKLGCSHRLRRKPLALLQLIEQAK